MSTATIYDVAQRAEVSVGTVSRYVNQSGYVGKEARGRIRDAIDALGFVPNGAARSLTTKKTGLIGFVVSDLGNPFTAELAHAVQSRANTGGYSVVISATESDEKRSVQALTALRKHNVDGLIVTPPESPAVNDHLVNAVTHGTPVVLIGMHLSPPLADRVTTDTYRGAMDAVRHLIGLGHTRIGFIGGGPDAVRGRRQGFTDALAAEGLSVGPGLIAEGPLNRDGGAWAARRFLDLRDPPTAVFAANDALALGLIQAAHARGVRVPDDLSVVGFDDVDLAAHALPPLTTVDQPKQEIAHVAVDLLLARLTDNAAPKEPVERRLPCRLVVRESTAPRSIRRPRAARRARTTSKETT